MEELQQSFKYLTAGHIEIASLLIKGEECKVHGAAHYQGNPGKENEKQVISISSPDAVQNISIWKYPHIHVGC